MGLFDGLNDEAPSIDWLKGNKNHLTPFLISSFGNLLFLKFEVGASWDALANPGGFFATIHYGNAPNSFHACIITTYLFLYNYEKKLIIRKWHLQKL